MLSRERRQFAEATVEMAGERAFYAAACLARRLAGGEESFVVGAGLFVVADTLERADVEGPVELAVAASVQSVAALLAARGIDRASAGERGEGCFAPHPTGVAARDEQLSGADRSHAALVEQSRRELSDQGRRVRARSPAALARAARLDGRAGGERRS